jgi:molybdopterin-guanine dinucleotide biosynthesis protein
MPETIHIRIEGGRGVGKTTIALAVAAFLRMYHALDVEVVGHRAADTARLKKVLRDQARDPNRSPGITERRRIVIHDDCRVEGRA